MNIYEIRDRLTENMSRVRANHGIDGYAYSSGWLESTLADALSLLAEHDTESVERILLRADKHQ